MRYSLIEHISSPIHRTMAWAMDASMCTMMNRIQWGLRHQASRYDTLDAYLTQCETQTREDYYAVSPMQEMQCTQNQIVWKTPVSDHHPENNVARAEWYCVQADRPTILLLHALMSAHAGGYRHLAKWFNHRGWNVLFPHLPCHYSRTPAGYWNGSLAMTSNLVRNAERMRQGVIEIRQLMLWLRQQGCKKFALLGTSYGGWMGSLVSFIEPDFEFVALLQPIANVEHALWRNPAAQSICRILEQNGISRGITQRHAHLSSPLDGIPLCGGERVLLATGIYDQVSPPAELQELARRWGSPAPLETPQGHFGYATLQMVKNRIASLL